MDDVGNMSQAQIASHTLAYLRRIDTKLDSKIDGVDKRLDVIITQVHRVSEILLRHEERLGRIERDVSEIKGDLVLMENQILNRMTEIFHVTRRLEDHDERLAALENPSSRPLA